MVHQLRREGQSARQRAEAVMAQATEQGFPFRLVQGMMLRGWALAQQGQREAGIAQICQGLAARRATGAALARPYYLALLAEAYGGNGQPEEGLHVLAEALAAVEKTGERHYEAELYRLRGELVLRRSVEHHAAAVSRPASHDLRCGADRWGPGTAAERGASMPARPG